MRFDSTRAWERAITWVRGNLGMLFPLAGIFLLLPGLAMNWFTTDLQVALESASKASDPGKPNWDMLPLMGQLMMIAMVISLVQSVGTMAMLVLFANRERPTVGEALKRGLQCLPTAIAAGLLLALGGMAVMIPLILVAGVIMAILMLVPLGAVIGGVLVFGGVLAAMMLAFARFFPITAVIAVDGVTNPVAALKRSWQLTKGNAVSLAFFLFLLFVAYTVIVLTVQALVGLALGVGAAADAAQLAQGGNVPRLGLGFVLGLLGAAFGTVLAGVTGAVHEQLGDTQPNRLGQTFE